MKRQWKLFICLTLAAITLCACSSGGNNAPALYAEVTQNLGPTAEPTPTAEPVQDIGDTGGEGSVFDQNPYDVSSDFSEDDPLKEEGIIDTGLGGDAGAGAYDEYASAEGTVYPYAGSTPIPIDPLDMPSPTPRPVITFSYTAYQPTIGTAALTFEAPVGWTVDESVSDVYTMSEPIDQMKNGQLGILTITAVPVANNYTENNLRTEVKQRLENISSGFIEWKPSLTATRYLLGSKGVYANYSGTMTGDIKAGGRVHYTCVDKVLYSVEIVYPLDYKDDYLTVFSKVRETIKRAQ